MNITFRQIKRRVGEGKRIVRSIVRKNKYQFFFVISDGKFFLLSASVQLNRHGVFTVRQVERAVGQGCGCHGFKVIIKHIHAVYKLSVMI